MASLRRNRLIWGFGSLVLLAIGTAWWLQRPSYLELPIELKWTETRFTRIQYADSWGAVYVCHKKADWKRRADITKFFDDWLRQRGWQYQPDAALQETFLLSNDVPHRFYIRQGHHPWEDPWVAVAVDPVYDGMSEVTLVTVQSSWLRRLEQSID